MNPFVFAFVAWIAMGLEIALPPVLDAGSGGVHPSFLIPLVVFVALHADQRPTLWAALILGLLADLTRPVAMIDGGTAIIPGPHALGFLLAAQLTLALRGMVMRRNPLTLMVLSVVAAAVSSLVVISIMTARTVGNHALEWSGPGQLLPGLLSALYTALTALVMSFPLFAAAPVFGFPSQHAPRFSRRD